MHGVKRWFGPRSDARRRSRRRSVSALAVFAKLAMWTREREGYALVSGGQRQHRAPPSSSCRVFFVLGLVGILLGLHRKSISVAEPSLQPPMPPEPAPAPPPPPPPPARGRRVSAPSSFDFSTPIDIAADAQPDALRRVPNITFAALERALRAAADAHVVLLPSRLRVIDVPPGVERRYDDFCARDAELGDRGSS